MRPHSLLAVLMMVLTMAICLPARAADAKATVGEKAPEFSLKDQNGKAVSLADHAGKIVVLEWFNNECPFVVKHYKNGAMNSTAARYADKDVVWLAIDSTPDHNADSAKKVAEEWKIDRPILDDSNGATAKAYGATNTPHMYVIDKEGKLAYKGAIDSNSGRNADENATNYVAKALDEMLQGKPVSQSETKAYGCSIKSK